MLVLTLQLKAIYLWLCFKHSHVHPSNGELSADLTNITLLARFHVRSNTFIGRFQIFAPVDQEPDVRSVYVGNKTKDQLVASNSHAAIDINRSIHLRD